ncbi:hypothetical protein [Paraburkholderia hospita]|jgi:hypothetical protein|uniref:Uncharacterized protein n=1 Tax=Paraburkholderia hospita TaxID=169430 RepID=A0AAN1JNC3_9BURK|nr:hypothetical protein [Paraburkholderia hospita]AUT76698.1 hypothetical protein C2L64_52370 [Paraburkholderia hospita]OUL95575.1 hypothetical protein CA603_07880 [Paraburkholderia hospita]SEI18881.1 hypothetical protein SAMN05192544_103321 [Paraburkholderia hospita]
MNVDPSAQAVEQVFIGLCGALAIYLSQDSRIRWRRWACIFGLAAQPFWFDMAWRAHQYGVLALSLVYAASWARGLAAHWLMRRGD